MPSMSRRGNCYDNTAVESFFSSLKNEKIRRHILKPEKWPKQKYSIKLRCFIIEPDVINT